jgi:hypothetical protein
MRRTDWCLSSFFPSLFLWTAKDKRTKCILTLYLQRLLNQLKEKISNGIVHTNCVSAFYQLIRQHNLLNIYPFWCDNKNDMCVSIPYIIMNVYKWWFSNHNSGVNGIKIRQCTFTSNVHFRCPCDAGHSTHWCELIFFRSQSHFCSIRTGDDDEFGYPLIVLLVSRDRMWIYSVCDVRKNLNCVTCCYRYDDHLNYN